MKVRLLQQITGTRNGQPWPAPGTVVDLPDAEAYGLLSSGTAAETDQDTPTVLVPPMGVHTPGTVAMPTGVAGPADVGGPAGGGTALVEAPADATADPDAARAAVVAAQEGDYVEGTAAHAHQTSTGGALTPEQTEKADKAAAAAEKAAAAGAAPKVGDKPAAAKK